MDPQGILHDLNRHRDGINTSLWNILWKICSKIQNQSLQIEGLNDHVGGPISTSDYLLNGQPEPQLFDDTQAISENIIGLKNTIQRVRKVLDNHISKVIHDSKQTQEKLEGLQFQSPSNALPKAEIEKLKKDIAEELAKNKSLSSGNAFNNLDLTNRIVTLEQNQIKTGNKLEAVGKAVSVIKKRTDPDAEDLPENKGYELDRIR